MTAAEALALRVGASAACDALAIARSTYYRRDAAPSTAPRPRPARALSEKEREGVLEVLTSEENTDLSPRQVFAKLLDRGLYWCSPSSMYRLLRERNLVHERRNQLVHPAYQRPELLATGPNELWSWDITKLRGPVTWTYFHLYVIMDVFSRFVVGWTLARRESAQLARELMTTACERQCVDEHSLILHADRGPAMTSKSLSALLIELGVAKTHSRPHVSNDNPFSEAHFKTMKYRPDYPERFGCLEDARQWASAFFDWYNYEHYHSGLADMTPAQVHYGFAPEVQQRRQRVLAEAYARHPERFVKGPPQAAMPQAEVWINRPTTGPERLMALERQMQMLNPASDENGGRA